MPDALRTTAAALLLAAAILAATPRPAFALPKPRLVKNHFKTDAPVIASAVVEPGGGDMSSAIQTAIDKTAEAGGGVIFLPRGRYALERPLVVKGGVTLRGDRPLSSLQRHGTILMILSGRNQPDGPPAITIERGAGIRDVTIWHPEQDPFHIVPYPWTLRTSTEATGDNFTVLNVTLVNPYQGFKTGPEFNELHYLRNIRATPLKTGIWMDTTTDIGRIIDVELDPRIWEQSGLEGAPVSRAARAALRDHLLREAVGVEMGRSDWEYIYGLRVTGCHTGLRIREGRHGGANSVLFGCRFEDCAIALDLEKMNDIGLAAVGCAFYGREAGVLARPSFNETAQFHTCTFRGGPHAVRMNGPGFLSFQNCRFASWTDCAVHADSGSTSILDCGFARARNHVFLGQDIVRARVLGCWFNGRARIANRSHQADVMIALQTPRFERPRSVRLDWSIPSPRPAKAALFLATDYGAAPENEDNTPAFRDALEAARASGGGVVYVAPGNYRCQGSIIVPSGVELRGCFDVPHHTMSGGSVLMPLAHRGQPDAEPFIQLETRSGLRGLTVWYPEQNVLDIAEYPWTIRSLGPECWLIDVTLGNAYQGVDFWTFPSDGHVIRYLAGAVFRKGLFVSKSATDGWVEDVQFNPHYSVRLHPSLPRPPWDESRIQSVIEFQRAHLEGMVFGRCAAEHLNRNFLYAAYDGIAFRDDAGGARARVVMHGSDTVSRSAVLEHVDRNGIDFYNAQLVPLSDQEVGAIVTTRAFDGSARFYNTQVWAGNRTAVLEGPGTVLMQQMNTLSGPIEAKQGRVTVENVRFSRGHDPHIAADADCEQFNVTACVHEGRKTNIERPDAPHVRLLANAASLRPTLRKVSDLFRISWDATEVTYPDCFPVAAEGDVRNVSGPLCTVIDSNEADEPRQALRITGDVIEPGHAFVYFELAAFPDPPEVSFEDVLRYEFRAGNDAGRHVAIDMLFSDGTTLRDSSARTEDGVRAHPGHPKGAVQEWRDVTIPLGLPFRGKRLQKILAGFDMRNASGPFEAEIGRVRVGFPEPLECYQVVATPSGGQYLRSVEVRIHAPEGTRVRYTLDGSNPTAASGICTGPVRLSAPGAHELRYAAERPDGRLSTVVFGELYEIAPRARR